MGGALQRTPLFEEHRAWKAKLVEFNNWEMPVQYAAGILKEHETVRSAAGLFDVSHMGRFTIDGPGAIAFVQRLITNDLEKAQPGQLLYSALCREDGGVLDDVTVYRYADRALLVVNAGNRARIWEWIGRQVALWAGPSVRPTDVSGEVAQMALQGPKAEAVLAPLAEGDLAPVGYYRFTTTTLAGIPEVLVSRNGYTGEDGFEIYVPVEQAAALWRAILKSGESCGALPIGLGARDTLRMEMGYCLYGNELDLDVSPLEAGIQWTVKFKKADFIGKAALQAQKEAGLKRVLAGFEVVGNRLPRHGQGLWREGKKVGVVTSGGFCPSLKRGMGLGFVPPEHASLGTEFQCDVRGTYVPVRVVERPFYKHASHK